MAFKLDDDADAYSDINVTPLVDVLAGPLCGLAGGEIRMS